jgi:hypothetical protein
MSNMLKEAIVDAKALRESALKNAETIVIDKYSDEVRKTLDHILEQDDMGLEMGGEMAPEEMGAAPEDPAMDPMAGDMDMGMEDPMMAEEEPGETEEVVENEDDLPYGATDGLADAEGKNLQDFPATGEPVEVSIDLGALQEALQELQDSEDVEISLEEDDDADQSKGYAAETDDSAAKEEAEAEEFKNLGEITRNNPTGRPAPDLEAEKEKGRQRAAQAKKERAAWEEENADPWAAHFAKSDAEGTNENLDSLVDAIAEKLTVDMGAELSGWAGRPTSQLKHEQERELAGMQDDDVKEELEALTKAQEKIVAENNDLKEQNNQYKQAVEELREGLQDVNLSNARLLYTNRVLRNTSLNERQKTKIVEAISSAGSVTEARTIFDTLQSTVEAAPRKSPQSLSEAIGRNRASVIRATRHESTASDPFQDRMQKLAGIK